jgi:DNA-binding MarR family transcriptional regulator
LNARKPDAEMIEDKYWMYETQKEMAEFFGFMDEDRVCRALKKLEEFNLIIRKNLSKNPFNRTYYYTVTNQQLIKKSLRNPPICGMQTPQFAESETPQFAECIYIDTTEEKTCSKQQQQKDVVSGGEKIPPPPKENNLVKDDIHAICIRQKRDWTPEEIDEAWRIYSSSTNQISDPIKYIEGIINKNRINQSNKKPKRKEKSCQKITNSSQTSQKPSNRGNESYSEKDMSESPLAKFARQNGLK